MTGLLPGSGPIAANPRPQRFGRSVGSLRPTRCVDVFDPCTWSSLAPVAGYTHEFQAPLDVGARSAAVDADSSVTEDAAPRAMMAPGSQPNNRPPNGGISAPAAAPAVLPVRVAGRVRAQRRQGRRTPDPAGHAHRRSRPADLASGPDPDRGHETTTASRSRPSSPTPTSPCCARSARVRIIPVPDNGSSNRSGRSSTRSTTPSRPNSTSNDMVDATLPSACRPRPAARTRTDRSDLA